MSVAVSWANKKQLAKCAYMVGFPISSHILYLCVITFVTYVNIIIYCISIVYACCNAVLYAYTKAGMDSLS